MNLQLNPPEPNIDKENPWADDALQREECAKRLTQVIEGQTEPLTISVNGSWGTGKTFLLKRWQAQLEKENYKVIYFNAWEDDFHQDPLLTIIGQIINKILKGPLKDSKNVIKQIKGSIGPALARIGLGIINGGIKSLTGVDISLVLEDIKKTDEQNLSDDYYMLCNTKNILKAELTALADTIYKDTGKPFIFIIDELDRCRPTFAIETLERVKHLFHIKNMIFVLGIARVSLEKSIRSVYGCINTFDYLHRFIDFEFNLPMIENKVFFEALWKRFQIQEFIDKELLEIKKYGNEREKKYASNIEHFQLRCYTLLKWHEFTLREIEQCMKLYTIALQSYDGSYIEPIVIIILVVSKIKFPKLYTKYLKNETTPTEIINALISRSKVDEQNVGDENSACIFTATIYWSFEHRYQQDILKLFNSIEKLFLYIEQEQYLNTEHFSDILQNPITSDFIKKLCEIYLNSNDDANRLAILGSFNKLHEIWNNYDHRDERPLTIEHFFDIAKKIDLISFNKISNQ
ncbi:MAG: AAA family ATPase [Verrucomicrobia bacterium]|nr:AAA family ATPase [Verrucomicrobiota bacterium]